MHRLLDKGYKPEHIELEPRWNLGREAKGGKADILVRDNERNPYLLIECKTAGSEFSKEWNKMQQDGGQLFSYFQQERAVKFLCLYTSDLTNLAKPNSIKQNQNAQEISLDYQNFIIATQDNKSYLQDLSTQNQTIITGYAHATSSAEAFEIWKEVYKQEYAEIGIFERNINAYETGRNALCFDDLQELSSYKDENKTYEDGKYHEFAKILRKYNISGKENAFDKLVNLFLCKIYDENHNQEALHFCFRGNASDSIEEMQDRLMLLYKEAMREFLNEEITYVSDKQIDEQFSDFKRQKIKAKHLKEQMQEFIRQLKFYSHSDFSFLEVHNKELFLQNGEVLKAVVKLFEKLKLTQNKTNQLLGNLFELFLQKGMKQDEGQFFTPMPICEFIIRSLPLETMLEKGTPKVIDYACGAGHFLNTYANILTQILPNDEQKQERLDELFSHIYGIEKEYRLSKVAKVAAAMFSQEKINITYADALDFAKFTYKDFDLLISNPPYSVKGFANTLNKSAYSKFELKDKVSDLESFNAIECFFIERANSLLASNAKLAIVLPSSILNKGGIYESTREIILRNFDIIAIVELGKTTFGATGIQTIILFATKRQTYANSQDSQSYLNLKDNIEDSLSFENVYLNGFLREYCEFMGYNQDDFNEFLNGKINEILAKTPEFSEYEKAFLASSEYANLLKSKAYKDAQNQADKENLKQAKFLKFTLEIEKDKLLYFALNHQNEVFIIKSPSDLKEQKKFLGYEWSNRKGNEGLKELSVPYTTPLFDRANPNNPLKINTLIKNTFLKSKNSQVPQELEKYALKARLVDMLDFSRAEFNKAITLNLSKGAKSANPFENSKFELVKLGEVCKILIGGTPSRDNPDYFGGNNLWVSIAEMKGQVINDTKEKITDLGVKKSNVKLIPKNTTLLSFKLSIGKTAIAGKDLYTNEAIASLIPKNKKELLDSYLFYLFNSKILNLENMRGNNAFGKSLNSKMLGDEVKIPKPPLEIQKQIVAECEEIEKQYQTIRMSIDEYKKLIKAVLIKCGICERERESKTHHDIGSLIESILSQINTLQSKLDPLLCHHTEALQKAGVSQNASNRDSLTTLLKHIPTPPQQGWEKAKLGEICSVASGGTPNREIAEYWNGNINWIKSEVCQNCYVYENQVSEKITELGLQKSSAKMLKKNSVLIALVGATIGKVGYLTFETTTNQNIAGLYPLNNKTLKTKFLYFATMGLYPKFKERAGFNMANLSFIKNLKIPLPPLKEQEKISHCIEKIEFQISNLNQAILQISNQKAQILEKFLK